MYLMIINKELIIDIFELKKKITGLNKNILSKYQDYIPMYDIRSQEIYPISKRNIHTRLINSDYRFVNNEIYEWLKLLYTKYKLNKELEFKFKKNLLIIENYNIEILIETSYKTLYEYSSKLGLLVSICKRNSFNPFFSHLKPYYTKLELIKLGQNMKIIDNINIEKLLNQDYHFLICKKVSSNDVSFDEIEQHTNHIIDSNVISYITFYSFFGSYLYNNLLRNNKTINNFIYEGINNIVETIKTSPKLNNDYFIYRFIWNDYFIKDIKVGDIYFDKGFLSTTRDPFYSPGLNKEFGITLIKINIKKNVIGLGLMIENFSLFAKEQEFLLPPNCKLKLISKDYNFKYFHINKSFEKLISKKYEFEFIDNTFHFKNNLKIKNNFKIIDDLKIYETVSYDRLNMFKQFICDSNQIMTTLNNNKYLFICLFFDSTSNSYSRLYYNKIKDGLLISLYDNGYPYLTMECGNEFVVNYINQYYYYNETKKELDADMLDIILEIGRIFNYRQAKIYYNYRNFSEFKYSNEFKLLLYTNFYNNTLYNYAKNKNKFLDHSFIKNSFGWYKIDEMLDTPLTQKIKDECRIDYDTIREAFIHIIENDITKYSKFVELTNINDNNYLTFEIYEKLNNQKRINNFRSNVTYDDEELGNDFKLIFRQPLQRY